MDLVCSNLPPGCSQQLSGSYIETPLSSNYCDYSHLNWVTTPIGREGRLQTGQRTPSRPEYVPSHPLLALAVLGRLDEGAAGL